MKVTIKYMKTDDSAVISNPIEVIQCEQMEHLPNGTVGILKEDGIVKIIPVHRIYEITTE